MTLVDYLIDLFSSLDDEIMGVPNIMNMEFVLPDGTPSLIKFYFVHDGVLLVERESFQRCIDRLGTVFIYA